LFTQVYTLIYTYTFIVSRAAVALAVLLFHTGVSIVQPANTSISDNKTKK